MNRKFTSILFIALILLSGTAFSQIYKWVDQDGNTHFSSTPPIHGEAETVEPKAINTYSSPDQSLSGTGSKPERSNKKVVMYSATWCGTCKTAKKYFKHSGIPFSEYDIETSAKGRLDYKRLKGKGVPIILVGKQRMDGFSASGFNRMYRE